MRPTIRKIRHRRVAKAAIWIVAGLAPALTGCYTNIDQVFYVGMEAAARTALDNWLTSVANAIVASSGG